LEAALEGAKAIMDGKLSSMNVSTNDSDKCYIHNNIFYTFCVDDYMKRTQPRGEEAPNSQVIVSADLHNIKYLEHMDGKDFHSVQTAIIQYRGQCLTAQSMIQGILYYDEKTWTKYGSVNDGKNIAADPEFNEIMKKISKVFHSKDNLKFKDNEGVEHTLNTSIDVKGIQGGDNRKYLLDLFRVCPRDLNWPEEFNNAVIFKPKLVEHYLNHLKSQVVEEVRSKFMSKITELKEREQKILAEVPEIKESETEEDKLKREELKKISEEKSEKLREELKAIQESNMTELDEEMKKREMLDYRFDASLYSGFESCYTDPEEEEKERQKLRDLAQFAKTKMVRRFIFEWSRMTKMVPIDSSSLLKAMANYGLSSRYLGLVLQALDPEVHVKQTVLVQRSILVRCLKYYLNMVIRTVPSFQLCDTLAHLLNLAVGGKGVSDFLRSKVAQLKTNKPIENGDLQEGEKKKKKKAKKIKEVHCDVELNSYLFLSPEEFFQEINAISEVRFLQKFAQKNFTEFVFASNSIDRISFLREICLSIGLCLGFRDFNLADVEDMKIFELPIKPNDIGEFIPIVKANPIEFDQAKINYAIGSQHINNGEFEGAVELFEGSLQALLNVFDL
jgi:hypothetical protein